jgi:ABC-type phosphate transport system substrate-binding protein
MSILSKSIRSALALSVAGLAVQSASALDISAYDASTVKVYLSGSTAVDGTILNSALALVSPGGLCQSGTVDVYYIGTASSYSNRMIFCSSSSTVTSSAGTLPTGTKLAIFKESNVGSVNGVTPLYLTAEGQPNGLAFINPAAITDANCATTATVAATAKLGGYTNHSGCPATATVNADPTAGFADVEAAILRTPTNGPVDAAATTHYLSSVGTLDQIWTILLTKNAFYALQAAEGFTSPSDLATNAPSLSREQIASILSGNLVSWSQLGVSSPVDDNVYLCRRDFGSGTEASFESEFLSERCSQLETQSLLPEDGTYVFAAGSGSGVRGCLEAFFQGGSITPYYLPGTSNPAGPGQNSPVTEGGSQFAIGINNAELSASNLSGANDSFRTVAIDGVGPTVANVQNGVYPYFSTGVSYQIKTGTGVPTGNPKIVAAALLSKLGHPAFTAVSNSGYTGVVPWSGTGDAAPAGLYLKTNPVTTVPSTSAYAATNPTNVFTKSSSGTVNNCDIPVFDQADQTKTAPESKLLGTAPMNN